MENNSDKKTNTVMREIKVNLKSFSLCHGRIRIKFSLDYAKGKVSYAFLRQRKTCYENDIPFKLRRKKGRDNLVFYDAFLSVKNSKFEEGFWDVILHVKAAHEEFDAILGGLSSSLKIKFILFPRWAKTNENYMVYPFVNGSHQFTIQYRRYNPGYDSYFFLAKEIFALLCYALFMPYWNSRKLWLICEKYSSMAQDNGLYFFKWCMENLPEKEKKHVLYVIDKKAADYAAVKEYESNVIQFMSFKYMIYLCAAQYLISTDAIRHFYIWDSPNSVFKVLYQARKHIIFLQHGVMGFKQCHQTFHKSGNNKMTLFVTSSGYEKKIITDYFGYNKEEVIVTGLPRWDVLENRSDPDRKEILLMPTWRSWLEDASEENFLHSDYYLNYCSLLTNVEFQNLLKDNNIHLNFYIHPKFRSYISLFGIDSEYIRVIPFGQEALNKLLMSCSLLITDYSSVAWDVYYQEKPVIFYTFDLEQYNTLQGSYMDLEKEAFGPVVKNQGDLLQNLKYYIAHDFKEDTEYAKKRSFYLPLRDNNNSMRVYEEIKKIHPRSKFSLKEKL